MLCGKTKKYYLVISRGTAQEKSGEYGINFILYIKSPREKRLRRHRGWKVTDVLEDGEECSGSKLRTSSAGKGNLGRGGGLRLSSP